MKKTMKYQCPKCDNTQFNRGDVHMTGGFWSKIFDIQGKRFHTVECTNCGYTEFFKRGSSSAGANIFDFLTT